MTLAVLLIVLPLLGAGLCAIGTERGAKWVGFLAALATFGVAVAFAFDFTAWHDGSFWPNAQGWEVFKAFGVSFLLGADSISMLLILLTALLMPCAMLVSFSAITERAKAFYACFLLLESSVLLAFLARDVILFYVGYEFALVPLFMIVAVWGGQDRKAASIKLFASEMANRVVDSCVQVLGGRGYMRENAVERFYRDLRVDRIWEGTSEIQKVVLVNEMRKRGTHAVAAWPKQG